MIWLDRVCWQEIFSQSKQDTFGTAIGTEPIPTYLSDLAQVHVQQFARQSQTDKFCIGDANQCTILSQQSLNHYPLYSFLLIATMKTNFHWSFENQWKNSWNEIGYYENPRPMELVVNFGTNIDEKIREMKSDTMKIHDQ